MNCKPFHRVFLFFLTNVLSVTALAQQSLVVAASVSKDSIVIGEHFTLTLEAEIPDNELIRFFTVDSLLHFEILEKKSIDTSNTANGTRLIQEIRLTCFDSGQWVIPPFVLSGNFATDSIRIAVSFSPFDPEQPYHDIKDVVEVAETKKKDWWWYSVWAVVFALMLWLLLRRKKKPVTALAVQVIDPYKEAVAALEKLERDKPGQKEYFSSLTDIFRLYVYRTTGILSLQKTTDDLVLQLRSLHLDKDRFDELAIALRLSDFVKFAKYQPDETDADASINSIRQVIKLIEQQKMASASEELKGK